MTIVEAAEEFLGIEDLKAEDIHGILKAKNVEMSQNVG